MNASTATLAVAVCVSVSSIAHAAVSNMTAGGLYATLQSAVNAASPGDVLAVSTGVYLEAVNISNTRLTIQGGYRADFSGAATEGITLVNGTYLGNPHGSVFDILNADVQIGKLEITGGGLPTLTLAGNGGGIDALASTVVVYNARIWGNSCKGRGAGIYAERSHIELVTATVCSNTALATFFMPNPGGGGIMVTGCTLSISGISPVFGNAAVNTGGGIFALDSDLSITSGDADVYHNNAYEGGGIAVMGGICTLDAGMDVFDNTAHLRGGGVLAVSKSVCRIQNGTFIATPTGWWGVNSVTSGCGGGIYIDDATVSAIGYVTIADNQATADGGGVYVTNGGHFTLAFSEIGSMSRANIAWGNGGAICAVGNSTVVLSNNFIVRNSHAHGNGGGVYQVSGSLSAGDGVVHECSAGRNGGGILLFGGGTYAALSNVIVRANQAHATDAVNELGGGGAAAVFGAALQLKSCVFDANTSSNHGGAIAVAGYSTLNAAAAGPCPPCDIMPPNQFINNATLQPARQGGAVIVTANSTARIAEALFTNNTAGGYGGAVYVYDDSKCFIDNAVMVRNQAALDGDCLRAADAFAALRHCTVADNDGDGVTRASGGSLALTNCIVWGHTNVQVSSGAVVYSCDVEGGFSGWLVMNSDPMFRDPSIQDYQLQEASPCIDTGIFANIVVDCLGVTRPEGPAVDLGAYEFVPEPLGGAIVIPILAALLCCRARP